MVPPSHWGSQVSTWRSSWIAQVWHCRTGPYLPTYCWCDAPTLTVIFRVASCPPHCLLFRPWLVLQGTFTLTSLSSTGCTCCKYTSGQSIQRPSSFPGSSCWHNCRWSSRHILRSFQQSPPLTSDLYWFGYLHCNIINWCPPPQGWRSSITLTTYSWCWW